MVKRGGFPRGDSLVAVFSVESLAPVSQKIVSLKDFILPVLFRLLDYYFACLRLFFGVCHCSDPVSLHTVFLRAYQMREPSCLLSWGEAVRM